MACPVPHQQHLGPSVAVIQQMGGDGLAYHLSWGRSLYAVAEQSGAQHLPGQFEAEFKAPDNGVADEFILFLIAGVFQAVQCLGELCFSLFETVSTHLSRRCINAE